MSDSLRMRVVEVLHPFCLTPGSSASDALDAMLDCLTENAAEIRAEVYELWAAAPGEPSDMLTDLLAVLREDRSDSADHPQDHEDQNDGDQDPNP